MAYNVASLIGTAIALPLLGVIAVILRFYVRLRLRPTYIGIDDWLIVLAVVLVVAQAVNQIIAATIGMLGRDDQPIVDWRVAHESKLDYATLVIEKVTYSAMKLSVLFFYRRIFYQQKGFRIANYILIALVSLWGIAFLFTEVFLCGANSHHGHPCAPQEWTSLWFAITDVVGDIAVLSLPYPCIRKLQMSKRDKIGLSAIFFLGTLSTVFAIVRLGFVAKTFTIYFHPSTSSTSPNRTPPSFWTTVEVSVGVFAACLPPLGPLIRQTPGPKKIYSSLRSSLHYNPFSSMSARKGSGSNTSSSSKSRLKSSEHDLEKGGSNSEASARIKELEMQLGEAKARERELEMNLRIRGRERREGSLEDDGAVSEKAGSGNTVGADGRIRDVKGDAEVNTRPRDMLRAPEIERGSVWFPYDRWL